MARIIGDLGSEKTLIEELHKLGVRSLESLSDVENHFNNSKLEIEGLKKGERIRVRTEIEMMKSKRSELLAERAQRRATRIEILSEKRDALSNELGTLEVNTRNPFKFLVQKYQRWRDIKMLRFLEEHFEEEVEQPFKELNEQILDLSKRTDHLEGHFEEEVLLRLAPQITKKERVDAALKQVTTWIIGARGERDVVRSLAELPDSFIIINDVVLRLLPPMKSPEGPRYQCQADHVVVGPSGVFNIETKYWSKKSIQSLDLRSPIEQIKFTGKALWRELNRAISNRQIKVTEHHWGDTSIQVKNILAMVGAMPNTEFQYVKMLPTHRLRGYLEYFEPVLQAQEIESIANWLS